LSERAAFTVEPWSLFEPELDLDGLAHTESVFALSNGHIGLRGNLDEGEPFFIPGTYLNGYYETRPLPYAEAAYGNPEDGQTVVDVTNGKIIRLLVDDEPFDIRYGELLRHERRLDLRDGTLRREVEWRSPTGGAVRVKTQRLVSFTQRSVAAVRFEVEPLEGPLRVVVQSELVANEPIPAQTKDPRAAAALAAPLVAEEHSTHDLRAVLVHITRRSRLRMAAGMDHLIEGPDGTVTAAESRDDLGRVTITADIEPGSPLRVDKILAYGWSSVRSLPSVRDQVDAALAAARKSAWDGLAREQRNYLDEFWDRADVELDGDLELQQAVRFSVFHTLQAGARAEQRAIPAKGLTGPGYDGHAFWDGEVFVLPMLTYTVPDAAADALRWRWSTLDLAIERAHTLHLEGASFPWRTIRGQECSGYWPAGTAAFHINAGIAAAVIRYVQATGDEDFARTVGLELLVPTARLWRSLGHHDFEGNFHIDGVTGPDEYTAIVDDNVYTNLMAQWNLRAAADWCAQFRDEAETLGVDIEEEASWRDAAAKMAVPYDDALEVHPQNEDFTRKALWEFRSTDPAQYPLLLHFPYFDLYRRQVVKQPDLVLAMHVRGDAFSPNQKARNFAYYEAITVRDSSLSACTQAVMASECGHLELAYDYFAEAAMMDIADLNQNTKDGLHIACLAGAWSAAVNGFGGMRDYDGQLSFAPKLPPPLTRLAFRVGWQGRRLCVEVRDSEATYILIEGAALEITHYGDRVTVEPGSPLTLEVPRMEPRPEPHQPPGRAPQRRRFRPV
jgi:alpha,alpha-trehalose phosphorylase